MPRGQLTLCPAPSVYMRPANPAISLQDHLTCPVLLRRGTSTLSPPFPGTCMRRPSVLRPPARLHRMMPCRVLSCRVLSCSQLASVARTAATAVVVYNRTTSAFSRLAALQSLPAIGIIVVFPYAVPES